MINVDMVSKRFDTVQSLDGIGLNINDGSVMGLIGSNGSGKSTLLKIICGVYKPDKGYITVDGEEIWENTLVKQNIVYLSDEQYFIPHSTPNDMMRMYKSVYPSFSAEKYKEYIRLFEIEGDRKLSTFSKGMQKQVAVTLGLACNTRYLICDETIDGLDAIMRREVCKIIADEVADGKKSVIFASHDLKEIEDICDHIALLHKGKLVLEAGLDTIKCGIHKVQLTFDKEKADEAIADIKLMDTVSVEARGRLITALIRGEEGDLSDKLGSLNPSFIEFIPLTLEEIFIAEMEDRGYNVK